MQKIHISTINNYIQQVKLANTVSGGIERLQDNI